MWILAAVFVDFHAFYGVFFPRSGRRIPTEADIIVSAADGKVTRIDENEDRKTCQRFSFATRCSYKSLADFRKMLKLIIFVAKKFRRREMMRV